MTDPVAITGPGMFLPAEACARLRHGALRDLQTSKNNAEFIHPTVLASVELMDRIGAWWAAQNETVETKEVPTLDSDGSEDVVWTSVTSAAQKLAISEVAVRKRLRRDPPALHGEQRPNRQWRVCQVDVESHREGSRFPHH
jgi:hypothetical protein